jgi:hypothetical protein
MMSSRLSGFFGARVLVVAGATSALVDGAWPVGAAPALGTAGAAAPLEPVEVWASAAAISTQPRIERGNLRFMRVSP